MAPFIYLLVYAGKITSPLNLTFALFALCYAATLFNGIRWYSTSNTTEYIAITRFDSIFIAGAFTGLIWYISYYTGFRPRIFLWVLSAIFIGSSLVFIISPATFIGEVSGLSQLVLPWGETLSSLDSAGSVWLDILLLARLVTLGYIIFALIRQFLRGERQQALILGLGMLPFIAGILYEISGEIGIVPFIPFGELGFLGIAVAASLQMANSIIRTEESLEHYQQDLKGLVEERTAELEAAQERLMAQAQERAVSDERSRLARDLHDVVTQILFSINLIAISLPRLWKRNPDMAERSTNELQRLTRGALAEMRTLLRELRPQTITATELSTLLTQLSDGLAARHDIPTDLNLSPICELPAEVHEALYRIAQEAMNNVAKHAEASHLAVDLACDKTALQLTISDDGHGFELEAVSPEHMGLDIMRERAEAIGADLAIQSRPAEGTKVTIICPLPQEERDVYV